MTTPNPPERAPVDPTRVRVFRHPFAWADVRLRERLAALSLEEIAVLFFLHLAADRNGCSFWSDAALARKVGLKEGDVIQARFRLVHRDLIAYRYPLFQILPLDAPASEAAGLGPAGLPAPACAVPPPASLRSARAGGTADRPNEVRQAGRAGGAGGEEARS
jgi:hypothetical protein